MIGKEHRSQPLEVFSPLEPEVDLLTDFNQVVHDAMSTYASRAISHVRTLNTLFRNADNDTLNRIVVEKNYTFGTSLVFVASNVYTINRTQYEWGVLSTDTANVTVAHLQVIQQDATVNGIEGYYLARTGADDKTLLPFVIEKQSGRHRLRLTDEEEGEVIFRHLHHYAAYLSRP